MVIPIKSFSFHFIRQSYTQETRANFKKPWRLEKFWAMDSTAASRSQQTDAYVHSYQELTASHGGTK